MRSMDMDKLTLVFWWFNSTLLLVFSSSEMVFFFSMLLMQPIPWAATLNIYKVPQKSLENKNMIHFKDPKFQLLNGLFAVRVAKLLGDFFWREYPSPKNISPIPGGYELMYGNISLSQWWASQQTHTWPLKMTVISAETPMTVSVQMKLCKLA